MNLRQNISQIDAFNKKKQDREKRNKLHILRYSFSMVFFKNQEAYYERQTENLMHAILKRNLNKIRKCLENGAKVNQLTRNPRLNPYKLKLVRDDATLDFILYTPLLIAISLSIYGHDSGKYQKIDLEIIQLLLKAGCKIITPFYIRSSGYGYSPLYIAIAERKFEIVRLLLQADNSHINDKQHFYPKNLNWEESALSLAVGYNYPEIVRLLLRFGAVVDDCGVMTTPHIYDSRITVVEIATKKNHKEILHIFKEIFQENIIISLLLATQSHLVVNSNTNPLHQFYQDQLCDPALLSLVTAYAGYSDPKKIDNASDSYAKFVKEEIVEAKPSNDNEIVIGISPSISRRNLLFSSQSESKQSDQEDEVRKQLLNNTGVNQFVQK